MSAGHDELRQEVDKIQSGTIIAVGVTALVIFALGILWAVQILRDADHSVRSFTPEQAHVGGQEQVGMVWQGSFDKSYGYRLVARDQAQLDSVGWVDQANKKVHIPIERAMKDYVADAEKNGGKL